MPDLFYLFGKWWKQIVAIVVISIVIAAIFLFTRPVKYLATATALPASSFNTDKASVFNQNIQSLYTALGTPDDLDVIIGTAQLDTAYLAIAQAFGLAKHYEVKEQGDAANRKAAFILKSNTRVIRSAFTELKIKVWDEDKNFAPELANAMLQKLQDIHTDLQNANNLTILNKLQAGREKIESGVDSIKNFLRTADITAENAAGYTSRIASLSAQAQQYDQLIGQYQLMVDTKPSSLLIVEKARAAEWPDKPKRWPILLATFALSLVFALLLALVLEKRKPA